MRRRAEIFDGIFRPGDVIRTLHCGEATVTRVLRGAVSGHPFLKVKFPWADDPEAPFGYCADDVRFIRRGVAA